MLWTPGSVASSHPLNATRRCTADMNLVCHKVTQLTLKVVRRRMADIDVARH
jgi:hypothetical protein